MNPGDWAWAVEHRQSCRVLDVQSVWGEITYRVWLPTPDAVVRVRADQLQSLDLSHLALRTSHLTYVAAVARVADSVAEVRSQLHLARDLQYISGSAFSELFELCIEISRLLGALRTSLDYQRPK